MNNRKYLFWCIELQHAVNVRIAMRLTQYTLLYLKENFNAVSLILNTVSPRSIFNCRLQNWESNSRLSLEYFYQLAAIYFLGKI